MRKAKVTMKRCLAGLLVLALCLTYAPTAYADEPAQPETESIAEAESMAEPDEDPEPTPEPDPEPSFYLDVPEGIWSYEGIRALYDMEMLPVQPYFYPFDGCTRVAFIDMLYKCQLAIGGGQGASSGGGASPFIDVRPGTEGYDAIMWATTNGVAEGVSDRIFGRERVLTREEVAVLILRTAELRGISLPKAADMAMFPDAADITPTARSYVAACQMAKLLSGKDDGRFDPAGAITNEQAANLVYRLYGIAQQEPAEGVELVSTEPGAYDEEFNQKLFFLQMPENAWAYPYVKTLYDMGMYEGVSVFDPTASTTRLEFVKMLYALHLALGGEENQQTESRFTDVPAGSDGFDAVMWAVDSGVTSGIAEDRFGPAMPLVREQCAEFLVRTARAGQIPLIKREDAALFKDSAKISKYARSSVTACQMADVINGYEDGKFVPLNSIRCQESAALVCNLLSAAQRDIPAGTELVSTAQNAYLDLYANVDYVFGTPVPACDPVPASWFDDAVFIGDSISVGLESYQNSSKALGNATMLCSVSLSAINALRAVSASSLHPKYQGVKRLLEDNVKACGAKNVYIMLGMNGLVNPFDSTMLLTERMIDNILKKNPDVNIFIQSVTPMTNNSYLTGKYGYTNNLINQFNERLKQLCAKRSWYYIDVNSALKDANGNLRSDFCSDNYDMGIHVTRKACIAWVEYLKTHVPVELQP